MTTRHEFLAELHELLKPKRYLEVGVQYGHSLRLCGPETIALGIDPNPLCEPGPNQLIMKMTSREFFNSPFAEPKNIDLAFIDGSHLVEDAIEDFENIRKYSHERTVIVFDDVLPYTQEMTSRTMIDGDWTGDVWKVIDWIEWNFPFMATALVDTFPTGLLVCWGADTARMKVEDHEYQLSLEDGVPVPEEILTRSDWIEQPEAVLADLKAWWEKRFLDPPKMPAAN